MLIIGAGISGIGAVYHLRKHCPSKSYAIIEARRAVGGTWENTSAKWHTEIQNLQTGELCHYSNSFFFSCAGYYNYEQGYTPDFKGVESVSNYQDN